MPNNKYREEAFIQEILPGMRGYGRYKYRVLNRHGFPTHHTDNIMDARQWFKKCVDSWEPHEPPPAAE